MLGVVILLFNCFFIYKIIVNNNVVRTDSLDVYKEFRTMPGREYINVINPVPFTKIQIACYTLFSFSCVELLLKQAYREL